MSGANEGWSRLHPSTAINIAKVLCAKTNSPTATNLLYFLYSQAFMHNNQIRLSYAHIAGKMGVGYKAVRSAALALEKLGLIEVDSRKGTNGGTVFSLSESIYQAIPPTNSNTPPNSNRSKETHLEKSKEHSIGSSGEVEWGDGDSFNRSKGTDNIDKEPEIEDRGKLEGRRIGNCPQCGKALSFESSLPGKGYCENCNTTVKLPE